MALEELIVAWSQERPAWQRAVMRRIAAGEVLSNDDYDQLILEVLAPSAGTSASFGLEHLPGGSTEDASVRLLAISQPEHVNALASDQPLTFAPDGLTIVYGDNGSGKSGYARLLKRITRARHREEVLSDVFRDTSLEQPSARLDVRIGDADKPLSWPDQAPPELQRVIFYDSACGEAYIATESDFPYRPAALFVMDGLIDACVALRARIDARLETNAKAAVALPIVVDGVKDTEAGRFLRQLTGATPADSGERLIKKLDDSGETIDDLTSEEARLRSADTSKERQDLTRQAEKLDALHKHIERLHSVLCDERLEALQEQRNQINTLRVAADVLAQSFRSEPLLGVGSSPWKALWESAKRFSEGNAYPAEPFPVVGDESRCVLCQQVLDEDGRNRLSRFEQFVKDDTQVRLDASQRSFGAQREGLTNLLVSPDAVVSNLKDLEAPYPDLTTNVRALLDTYDRACEAAQTALAGDGEVKTLGIDPAATLARLAQAAHSVRETAAGLSNPAVVQQRLVAATAKRQELELLQEIKNAREAIIQEIARLKEREALEAAKTAAATGPITKKVMELSEESITEVVRDAFTRETERLHLERVTIARTRADKGALLHQPKLVGARQDVKLPRVFSEGERTALGLAAFFTEAHLDVSQSTLILDDPVTSLDHIRRGLVATRLAALAESRQVIVFTHDVSFVADLKREASGRSVTVTERSVTRSRAEERKPGVCNTTHPWKAKDVAGRLNELRQELARLKKETATLNDKAYEDAVAVWAGNLSETWERIFSQEIVGVVLAEGGLEVRPMMVKVLARFTDEDHRDFDASYSRVSQWAKRHDKSVLVNYVPPQVDKLEAELGLVDGWFKRVKGYRA